MKVQSQKTLTGRVLNLTWEGIREKDYQIKMMEKNPIAGLLPVSMAGDAKETWISYHAGGKKTLKDFLKTAEADRRMGEKIVACILEQGARLEDYMLLPGRLLLDVEMIFRDEERLYFCYNPYGKDDFMGRFRTFAKVLFVLSKPGEEAFFIQLQKLLLDPAATALDLKKLCGMEKPEKPKQTKKPKKIKKQEKPKKKNFKRDEDWTLEEIPNIMEEAEDIEEGEGRERLPPEPEEKLSFQTETIPEEILYFDDELEKEKGFFSRVAEKGITFFREPFGKK